MSILFRKQMVRLKVDGFGMYLCVCDSCHVPII